MIRKSVISQVKNFHDIREILPCKIEYLKGIPKYLKWINMRENQFWILKPLGFFVANWTFLGFSRGLILWIDQLKSFWLD